MFVNQAAQKFCLRISGTQMQDIGCVFSLSQPHNTKTDISCNSLPHIGRLIKEPGSFYLVANVAGVSRRTNIAKRSDSPSWDDSLNL
jgi:hypothetical protein